jgi:hypothetical protein
MIVNLLRFVEVSYRGLGILTLKTDVPGSGLTTLVTLLLPNHADRRMIRIQLPSNSKTVNLQARFTADPSSVLLPFSLSVMAKALGQNVTGWRPIPIPIPRPGEDWVEVPIPVPETPEGWVEVQIPVPPTSEEWGEIPIVADDGSEYRWYDLPGGQEVST